MTLADLKAEALAQVDQLRHEREEAHADLKRTRAMIEHLTAIIRAQDSRERQRLVEVATKQREACAAYMDEHRWYTSRAALSAPLVTESEK